MVDLSNTQTFNGNNRPAGVIMDMPAVLSTINAWSVDERIRLVQDIWDGIAAEQPAVVLTDAQKQELDRRLKALESAPDEVTPWEEIDARARARGRA
jgi:putative addiction module component (TIGR02574 family)